MRNFKTYSLDASNHQFYNYSSNISKYDVVEVP